MGLYGPWSPYGQTGRITRRLFYLSDALTIFFSIACLSYGAWLVHNRSQYAELLEPSLYVDVGRIMIVVSIISMIFSIYAIYALANELRCGIYFYGIASLVTFVMLFLGGIMGFVFCNKLTVEIPLDLKMSTSLRELYGAPEMGKVKEAWDELQINFRCCGVNGTDDYMIWRTSKWYMHQRTQKIPIPYSCCYPGDYNSCIQEANGSATNSSTGFKFLYTSTCYEPLKADLLNVVDVAAWMLVVSSVVQGIPAVFAIFYARLIKK
ncbi:unnamed protein product, partial [Mesorhabditis belari]|uniref:Tetraspanin n=1 Tax=Mesorhabditis belari TaxID=2138241 RepID=A0AAF3J3T1_9BILA